MHGLDSHTDKKEQKSVFYVILFHPFMLASAAINKVQLGATNFAAQCSSKICKFGKKRANQIKFGRRQLNACLTFRRAAIQRWFDCNFQQIQRRRQHFQQTFIV